MIPSKKKYWGWGNEDVEVPIKFLESTLALLSMGLQNNFNTRSKIPNIDDIRLIDLKVEIPKNLVDIIAQDKLDRICHTYGQAFRDVIRALTGDFSNAPDFVAHPKTELELSAIIDFAKSIDAIVIPYGGGTTVCGGIECRSDRVKPVISLDLKSMNKILHVNEIDLTARIQAGALGPDIEKGLKPYGLTLRHFPQSFEFSTLGGWIATRSGGHFATRFTQIDEFVQHVRMYSPSGITETPKFPNSGAGPNINRIVSGSEGILGIITEATLRLQKVPKRKLSQTIKFKNFSDGVQACRHLAQSALYPSNARLIGALEALGMNLGDGSHSVLILGFEFHDIDPEPFMKEALKICELHGGIITSSKSKSDEKSEKWKSSFLMAPYLRDELILHGLIVETFETCVTWEKFDALYESMMKELGEHINQICGMGYITCRFTHLYPDGPAPYFTVMANGKNVDRLDAWDKIKQKAGEILWHHQSTITHHHAVGRDHQAYFEKENPNSVSILKTLKQHFDPKGMLNPGVLIRD